MNLRGLTPKGDEHVPPETYGATKFQLDTCGSRASMCAEKGEECHDRTAALATLVRVLSGERGIAAAIHAQTPLWAKAVDSSVRS